FVFITGITKFTKTSIFSKFNNFVELSLHEDYTTICGITHNEFKHYYHDQIEVMALKNKLTYNEVLDKFNHWYDGYSWDGINKVYNPFSTLNALYERKFMGFWFGSGTPTFLAETFKHKEIIEDYSKPRELKYTELDAIDPENINLTALLFQGGYLTIDKEFIQEDIIRFSLKIPNFEVEQAYKDNLLNIYLNEVEEDIIDVRGKLWEDIKKGDCESLSDYLEIQFDEIPYHLNLTNKRDRWKVKQIIFLKLVEYMGFKAKGEVTISQGRIDAVFRNKNHIIVSEVKYTQNQKKSIDDLMNKSLNQIHEKQYYRIYKKKNYNVILIALAFKDIKINKKDILTEVKCKIEILNN
ncbi:MAG: ATP-binding protein, partial [Methanobrevibacter sp.]|nr:ATP-binding protein [Candidatus Methanovirga procula]